VGRGVLWLGGGKLDLVHIRVRNIRIHHSNLHSCSLTALVGLVGVWASVFGLACYTPASLRSLTILGSIRAACGVRLQLAADDL